jgi:hypothetical protein
VKIRPKNWATFQHYKDRAPPWIKLHRGLLDDYEFHCLPVASRALAPLLWLLASENTDGWIEVVETKLAFRVRMNVEELKDALKHLIDGGFFESDSKKLARRKRVAMPETERETQVETETEGEGEESAAIATLHPRGTRWPSEAVVPEAWKAEASEKRASSSLSQIDIDLTAEQFANYWSARAGPGSIKLDWKRTWMNWATTQKAHSNGPRTGSAAHANFAIGALAAAEEFDRSH